METAEATGGVPAEAPEAAEATGGDSAEALEEVPAKVFAKASKAAGEITAETE